MFMQDHTAFAQAATIDLDTLLFPGKGARSGLVAGTRIEAADGWRPVETLVRGDAVFTFDGGLRQVHAIRRNIIAPTRLLHVPGGALDNCAAMTLLPGQHVLIEDARAERAFGSALVLVPAAALAGLRGVRWDRSHAPVETATPVFAEEELVWGNTGALLYCPQASGATGPDFFTKLGLDQARALIALKQADEGAPVSAIRAA